MFYDGAKVRSILIICATTTDACARGCIIVQEADENTSGPASLVVTDPDGDTKLVDQYV